MKCDRARQHLGQAERRALKLTQRASDWVDPVAANSGRAVLGSVHEVSARIGGHVGGARGLELEWLAHGAERPARAVDFEGVDALVLIAAGHVGKATLDVERERGRDASNRGR